MSRQELAKAELAMANLQEELRQEIQARDIKQANCSHVYNIYNLCVNCNYGGRVGDYHDQNKHREYWNDLKDYRLK